MKSIENARSKENAKESFIPVITRKETARVNIGDIFYIETELRVIKIHTGSKIYRFYGKLDTVLKYLDDSFYRCHKSCIINLEKIVRMENGVFYFPGGVSVKVGQNNFRLTRNRYIKYLEQNADANS